MEKAGNARSRLRDACAIDHARVDDAFSGFHLSTRNGYSGFLAAQAACLAPVEDALTAAGIAAIVPDWADRQRASLLAEDLADLHVSSGEAIEASHLSGTQELLGALYVLEGSRFGGAVLSRRVFAGAPVRFLTAAAPPKGWRVLMDLLDENLKSEADYAAAISAAKAVFRCFEMSGTLILESARV